MEPTLAQTLLFAGNFAPRGWALCHGQLLPINSNQALFSLIGTIYGGDGRTTFALPDLRGRVPLHQGSGPGLTPRTLGQKLGKETHTLTTAEMPNHDHTAVIKASRTADAVGTPTGNVLNSGTTITKYTADANRTNMGVNPSSNTGGNGSHTNMMPTLGLNYIICTQGLFPSRS